MSDAFDTDAFVRGYELTALWSSSIEEDFLAARREALGTEIREAQLRGRDPQRQLCELADLDDFAPDTSMHSFGFEPDAIDSDAHEAIAAECEDFIQGHQADLLAYCEQMGEWHGSDTVRGADARYSAEEQAGGDFWLTRNGHGAGYWDRGLGELGERLSEAAKAYGSSDLYLSDHERIYVT